MMRSVAGIIVETWVGADGLPLQFATKDSAGAVFALTGYTLTLTAKLDGDAKINAAAVTVTDAASGLCEFQPTAAQVDTAGEYEGLLWLTLTSTAKKRPSRVFTIRVNAV
jgi:hypothetical protein